MGLIKLKATMAAVLAFVFGLATLVMLGIFYLLAPNASLATLTIGSIVIVASIQLLQWLLGPKIIEAAYRVKPVHGRYAWVEDVVQRLARESGLSKPPKAMIAMVDVPNAFAYGNVFTGYKVAVTKGLLNNLPRDEVEAVIGHEIGHIVHRDVEIMMIASIIPAILFWLGRILMYSAWFGVGDRRSSTAAFLPLIGLGLMAFSFIFNFVILYLSRLREYYADSHSALVVPGGAVKLQRALARILVASGTLKNYYPQAVASASKFKALLIADPEQAPPMDADPRYIDIDRVVQWIKSRRSLTGALEIFSSHPDPAKRLRFLDELARELGQYYA